ncbi:choice-of-anchor D domain-containing protein [Ectothiorhodospiraceae bacterium WFHF3C12]|nr:choice-of-anchor D domain-containing protein [Ectothiorhodospiraceae bacterium WFHF3C12]
MSSKDSTRNPGRLRSAIAAAALFGVAGTASAEPVSLTLDYTCPFPLIGEQTITAEINTDIAAEVTAPSELGPFDIEATTTVPAAAVEGLSLVGATTIEGTATNESTVVTPAREIPQTVNLTIPQSGFPDEPQAFTVPASGSTSVVSIEAQDVGDGQVTVGGLTLDMTARLPDGSIAPAPVGEFTAECTQVAGQDNVLQSFTVSAEPQDPDIAVDPASISFPDVTTGDTSSTRTVTVSNEGDGALTVSGASLAGSNPGAFSIVNNGCGEVAVGNSCAIDLTFSPPMAQDYSAELQIASNDPDEATKTVSLTGTGTIEQFAEITVTPESVDFGGVQMGNSAEQTVTVTNEGNIGLGINGVSLSGATDAFTQTSDCGSSVAAGASCTVTVTYMPTAQGDQNATLSIASTDEDEPTVDVALSGSGEMAPTGELHVSPDTVEFGSVTVGENATQDVTVSNTGDAGFNVTAVNLGGANVGDFTIIGNDCGTVAGSGSCTVSVQFTPSTEGARSASLTVETDLGENASETIELTGTGGETGGGGTIETAFDLSGETFIKAADSSLPLSGTIDAVLELASGTFTADLDLDPTSGSFKAFGFVNAKAKVAFEPVGETTGTLNNGNLSAESQLYVKVPKVTAKLFFFRVPIGGGPDCRTMDPVNLSLATPEGESFAPRSGGPVTGTYSVPALENCGPLTGLLNQFLAGPGNTIDLTLTGQSGSGNDSDGDSGDSGQDEGEKDGKKKRFSWWRR